MTPRFTARGRKKPAFDRARRTLVAGLVCGLVATEAHTSEVHYLKRNERFCDVEEILCIRGTLSYAVNPRLLSLWGRVQTTPGRGLLRIRLAGTTRLNYTRTTEMEIDLRGTYSEIIEYKMIPDHPDVDNWEITVITFIPRDPTSGASDAADDVAAGLLVHVQFNQTPGPGLLQEVVE